MVKLIPITFQEVRSLVYHAFDGDIDLLEKYHVSPGDLPHCVQHTMEAIEVNYNHFGPRMEFYAINSNGEAIGYTVIIRNETGVNELYSFGVNIKYRTKKILLPWLVCMMLQMDDPFYIVLWSKNTRAINFFERNMFKVDKANYLNDETKTLILCQPEE